MRTDGAAIVVNMAVRACALTPPWTPLRPLSTVTVYRVCTPSRCDGFQERTVCLSFQLSPPGGAMPVSALTMLKPDAALGSIGWLNVTSTCCQGPQ